MVGEWLGGWVDRVVVVLMDDIHVSVQQESLRLSSIHPLKELHLCGCLSVSSLVVLVGAGVSRNNAGTKWKALIWVNGKTMHLGTFEDETDAAKVSGTRWHYCFAFNHWRWH